MVATASIKTDELLASWLGSETIYENVMRIIETQKASNKDCTTPTNLLDDGRPPLSPKVKSSKQQQRVEIPPFYSKHRSDGNPQMPPPPKRRYSSSFTEDQSWHGDYLLNNEDDISPKSHEADSVAGDSTTSNKKKSISLQAREMFTELGTRPTRVESSQLTVLRRYLQNPSDEYHTCEDDLVYIPLERFERITKELCNFPTFFHKPLYERILMLWSTYYHLHIGGMEENLPPVVTYGVFHYFWKMEMAPFDKNERFFRLLKRPEVEYITRDDFFPYIKELLNDHPVSFCCVFCVYWFVCASVCLDVLCLLLLLLLLLIHSIYRG
jgi:hypothetical protein